RDRQPRERRPACVRRAQSGRAARAVLRRERQPTRLLCNRGGARRRLAGQFSPRRVRLGVRGRVRRTQPSPGVGLRAAHRLRAAVVTGATDARANATDVTLGGVTVTSQVAIRMLTELPPHRYY